MGSNGDVNNHEAHRSSAHFEEPPGSDWRSLQQFIIQGITTNLVCGLFVRFKIPIPVAGGVPVPAVEAFQKCQVPAVLMPLIVVVDIDGGLYGEIGYLKRQKLVAE
ncbi:hypothetical protein SDC9_169660 [bioreactor metagenome]|uniref:Uncharacterized protein n=1 Tax=bioreactor metagenome TaxID=1076179 RepID=A0A645G5T2_9ZZZZ